jgi:hypothetical protein
MGPARLGHLSLARHLTASQTVWTKRVLPALPKLMQTGRSKWICLIALPNVCRSRTFRQKEDPAWMMIPASAAAQQDAGLSGGFDELCPDIMAGIRTRQRFDASDPGMVKSGLYRPTGAPKQFRGLVHSGDAVCEPILPNRTGTGQGKIFIFMSR